MFIPFLKGFGIGGSLIIAIGAQNAFVLSNGVKRNYYLTIPAICIGCDALLVFIGIAGIGKAIAANSFFTSLASWAGAIYLLGYGIMAFRSAYHGGELKADAEIKKSFRSVVYATLAVTFLNPHVYLDTVILIGSISSQFSGLSRYVFGIGVITASILWFFSLSLGGKLLSPFFCRPFAWRILDTTVGITMWAISLSLIKQQISPM
ncbi:MAG: amino acid transporter [Desulfobacteraceae bacterium]|nr:amino acid transporter [Desulfobacteraceae bacterium]